jgi:outer membrane lipoprotein-sorting protein
MRHSTGSIFMIFGKMKNNTKNLIYVFGVIVFILCQSVSAGEGYADILHKLSKKNFTTVKFKEKYDAFYLDSPLISTGEMSFKPPDKLIKTTLEPNHISQEIIGNEVIVTWGDGKIERFSLDQHRGLESMANTLRAVLSGNIDYIDINYVVDKLETQEGWKLILLPKNTNINKWIKKIELNGSDGNIRQFIVTEVNGDNTTTTLYEK